MEELSNFICLKTPVWTKPSLSNDFWFKISSCLYRGQLLDCLIKGESGTVNGFRMNKILKTATKEKWQAMREIKGGWYHRAKMSQIAKQHSVLWALLCRAQHLREKIGGKIKRNLASV